MKIKKALKKKLLKLMPGLQKLKKDLQELSGESDALIKLIRFFETVSVCEDQEIENLKNLITTFCGKNKKNYYDEIIKELKELQTHLNRAGRNMFGMNRTAPGDSVNDSNVYLGNIKGLSTLPVSSWKAGKDKKKGGWGFPGMEDVNSYDVVCLQAQRFMESHIKPMIEIIDWLEKIV